MNIHIIVLFNKHPFTIFYDVDEIADVIDLLILDIASLVKIDIEQDSIAVFHGYFHVMGLIFGSGCGNVVVLN